MNKFNWPDFPEIPVWFRSAGFGVALFTEPQVKSYALEYGELVRAEARKVPIVVYTVNERDEERGDDRMLDVFWTREKADQFVKERQTPCWVEEHYRDAF